MTALALTLLLPLAILTGRSAHAEAPPPPQGVVNINSARAEELMLLPRIGEGKAQRIIEFRAKTPFKTVNELARVKGIGLRTLRLLKPWLTTEGPTTLTSEVRATQVKPDPAEPERSPREVPPSGGARPATKGSPAR
ncbi:MAG: helix-hairpin-helix domain-containing protein [Deltaproteobacteria bacterium]|nr:helix-hairpin-helix domain-containing protein [Deltaproteobacteria bacterium]